jgi:site-specific DNA-cytosine methylase
MDLSALPFNDLVPAAAAIVGLIGVLAGKPEQQWRQLGNAVPPTVAEILGARLKQYLAEPGEDHLVA